VQWLTAGAGIVHSEMFPLLKPDASNRLELFQIWVNLPAKAKFAKPYFTMFWDKDVPRVRPAAGVTITLVAGALDDAEPPKPPPDSWAANPEAELAIWLITLEQGATWVLPPAHGARTARTLYFFSGRKLEIAGRALEKQSAIEVAADRPVALAAPDGTAEVLLMQGRPIGEPVAQYGPFVMNTRAELEQAFYDYRRTQFGGWPFRANDPVHPRERGRFARHADGRVEDAPA
jgi:redox-sensitive bicupin YhaK (pirin superfamily)